VHVHEKANRLQSPSGSDLFLAMDHEKLDVYRVSLDVVTRVGAILKSKDIDRSLRDQVVRSSTSILLNIAEGTGKRSPADRRRFYEIARGSAMETAAALDVLLAWQCAGADQVTECKALLRRVVAMLTKMTEVPPSSVREEPAEYATESTG
jgi:four helix bundle protein